MGKRKATRVSPRHVEVQCDIWLTAKPPKKQKVLSRDPLHFYSAQIRDEPTLLGNVPKATKQTKLNDFFGKGKDLRTGKRSCHTPELHPTEHYGILHEIRSSRDNITPNARVVESAVKQEEVKTRTQIVCKQSASHHRDESAVNDRFLGSRDNQKCTFQRPSNTKHQGRSRLQESERNVLQGSLRNERQDHQADSEDEVYDDDDDDVEDVSVDVDCKMMRMSDQCNDKDAFLKQVTGLRDFPTRGQGSHIPDFGLPKSSKASSNDRSVNPPVDDLPCRITFVSLRQAEMSPISQETELEFPAVGHSACSQSSMPVLLGDLYTQPDLHVDRLRYVDPDHLDTAPDSQTDTSDSGDDQLITTQSLVDLSEDLSVVDLAVLEVNTADMPSTEEKGPLSENNVHYRYPAPMVDQSPLDSLEFTIGTEGRWLLKRPPADDVNDSYADDSQMF